MELTLEEKVAFLPEERPTAEQARALLEHPDCPSIEEVRLLPRAARFMQRARDHYGCAGWWWHRAVILAWLHREAAE